MYIYKYAHIYKFMITITIKKIMSTEKLGRALKTQNRKMKQWISWHVSSKLKKYDKSKREETKSHDVLHPIQGETKKKQKTKVLIRRNEAKVEI